MSRFLAISSQVARGHVGLSAIVPAVQALGHEIIALPTVLLSNHPGHAKVAGTRVEPQVLNDMLAALDDNGWLSDIDAVLTGYLPSRDHVAFACHAIAAVQRSCPDVRVVCDPILGDDAEGLYIAEDAANTVRDELLPLAHVAIPNRFELAWLTRTDVSDVASAIRTVRQAGCPSMLVTSLKTGPGELANLLVGSDAAELCRIPMQHAVPKGTGDFLSGVFLADPDLARTTARVAALIDASTGRDELAIAESRDAWLAAHPLSCEIVS